MSENQTKYYAIFENGELINVSTDSKIKDILEKLKTINVSIFTFDDLEQLNALIESQKPSSATASEKAPAFKNVLDHFYSELNDEERQKLKDLTVSFKEKTAAFAKAFDKNGMFFKGLSEHFKPTNAKQDQITKNLNEIFKSLNDIFNEAFKKW